MSKAITFFILSIAASFLVLPLNAQTMAQVEHRLELISKDNPQLLETVLHQLESVKGIYFLYESSLVKGVVVEQTVDFQKSTKEILNHILPQADLSFKKIDDANYVIKKAKIQKNNLTKRRNSSLSPSFYASTLNEKLINGVVSDFRTGESLIGVTIVVKGQEGIGTVTNFDGSYSLNVPDQTTTLIFSFIGYETKEVQIEEKTTINVWLNEAVNQLDEVVVTAVGIEAKKRGLGYSIEEIGAKEIEHSNEANIVSSLSGKSAGVFVTASSGSPGASANIRIRGNKSINGSNKPLFIIDGVPIDNTSSGNGTVGVDVSNRAIDINPNDVENISVLKGPAATALYGIRAANGAIFITTKRGKVGAPRITLRSSFGLSEVNQVPARQFIYSQGTYTGGQSVYRGPESGEANSFGLRMDQLEYDGDASYLYDTNGRLVPKGQGNGVPAIIYNPEEDFFDTGYTYDNNVSVSGGSEKLTYYISAGNYYQKGVVPKSDWNRTSFKGNFDVQLSDRLSLGSNTTIALSGGDRKTRGNALSGVTVGLFRSPISFDNGAKKTGRDAANTPNAYIFPNGEQRAYRGTDSYDNPYWSVNRVPFQDEVNRLIQSVSLKYKLTPWLSAAYKIGLDHYSDKRESAWDIHSGSEINGRIDLDNRLSTDLNSDFLLLFNKDFDEDFSVNATLGHNYFSSDFNTRSISGVDLSKQGFYHISNAAVTTTNESISRRKLVGVFADVKLDWKNIVYLNLTGRNDWSSTLPKQNNSFFYPTVSFGLEFTELFGLTDHKFLSYGKLRASYGQVGNDASIYLTENYYNQADADGDNLLAGNSFPAFGINSFERAGTLGNADLKAETTTTIELGADLKLLLGRFNIDFTYYKATTTDLIVEADISAPSGFIVAPINAGEIENEGIELLIEINPIRTDHFRWDIGANFTAFKNIVTELPEGIDQLSLASFSALSSLILEGEPYGVLVGTAYQRNTQGQMIIGADGWPLINTEQIKVGDPNPDWLAGIRNTFTYKGLRVSALLDIRTGGDIWNGTMGVLNGLGVGYESGRDREITGFVYEGVTESGEINTTPVDFANPANGTSGIKWKKNGFLGLAEDNIEDASWFRLREVVLSYTFPQRWFGTSLLKGATLSLSGRNLWLKTDYTGIDPETNLRGDSNATGWDYFNLPNTKGYSFSLNLNF
ncbi:MAG: SusC/RagA family TonB-linked outer membrane protein [Saprospiraceae bacterium]|nr:MAG: SusC/RagA family TonB-linked outer membrane protein [Saprospiraceae bacterium]